MRIAITGGRGGVGKAVIKMALSQGHTIVSIDITPIGPAQNDVSEVMGDITRYADLENAFRGCDAVVHLAAIPAPDLAEDYNVHNNNVVGSYNALSAARRLGIKHVCQASSINAIGAAYSCRPRFDYFPLDEEHPTYNEDPYSFSQVDLRTAGRLFARRYEDMTISSMRFHWVVPDRPYAVRHKQSSAHECSRNLWAYTPL